MNDTYDSLMDVQAAIESLFSRPVSRLPAPMDPNLHTSFLSSQAYAWGVKNLAGVAVSWPQAPEVHLYLVEKPIPGFRQALEKLLPNTRLRLWVTGRFHFAAAAAVGGNISLDGDPELGTVALFLTDGKTHDYALTCAHVLDAEPASKPQVDSGADRIGALTERVDISYSRSTVNQVDCALATLDKGVGRSNSLAGGGSITGVASAQQNQQVTIVTNSGPVGGTVANTNTHATIYVVSDAEFAYFEKLISITGAAGVGGGDSGSVVLSDGDQALGMLIAASPSGMVLACDMPTVVNKLQTQVQAIVPGGKLSLI